MESSEIQCVCVRERERETMRRERELHLEFGENTDEATVMTFEHSIPSRVFLDLVSERRVEREKERGGGERGGSKRKEILWR